MPGWYDDGSEEEYQMRQAARKAEIARERELASASPVERPEQTAHTTAVIASTAEYVGLTKDQKVRFVRCLLAVGLEIVPTANYEALKQSHAALRQELNRSLSVICSPESFEVEDVKDDIRRALATAKAITDGL